MLHFIHLPVAFTILLRPSATIQQVTDMTGPELNSVTPPWLLRISFVLPVPRRRYEAPGVMTVQGMDENTPPNPGERNYGRGKV